VLLFVSVFFSSLCSFFSFAMEILMKKPSAKEASCSKDEERSLIKFEDGPKASPKLVQISARRALSPSTTPTTSTKCERVMLLLAALRTVIEIPSGAWPTKSAPSDLNTLTTVVTLRPRYFFNSPAFTMGRGLQVSVIVSIKNVTQLCIKHTNCTPNSRERTHTRIHQNLHKQIKQYTTTYKIVHPDWQARTQT